MKIFIAQTRPHRGQLHENMEQHKHLIAIAASLKADLVVFPELSLTGYEPTLASSLALPVDSPVLDVFQSLATTHQLVIGLGLPLQVEDDICIATVLFRKTGQREVYTKQFLHPDEEEFFVEGKETAVSFQRDTGVALAICYELSVPHHAEAAISENTRVYLTSVAKTEQGVQQASSRLSNVSREFGVYSVMVNAVGLCEEGVCAGGSAVWGKNGKLLKQLGEEEGFLFLNTESGRVRSAGRAGR